MSHTVWRQIIDSIKSDRFLGDVCKTYTIRPFCLSCLSVCPVCSVGVLWPNGWMDQNETWHAGSPRLWPHCLRWGPSSSSPKGHSPPEFSAHICCDQMAGWIKMPLGREVGLGPSDIVLDGNPAHLPKRGHSPQIFGPCLLWPRSPISATAELLFPIIADETSVISTKHSSPWLYVTSILACKLASRNIFLGCVRLVKQMLKH